MKVTVDQRPVDDLEQTARDADTDTLTLEGQGRTIGKAVWLSLCLEDTYQRAGMTISRYTRDESNDLATVQITMERQ